MVTPLGLSVDETWAGCLSGNSGIARLDRFDVSAHPCQAAATVPPFDITSSLRIPKNQKFMNPGVKFAIRAVKEAIAASGVESAGYDAERIALHTGSGHPGPEASEFFAAFSLSSGNGLEPDYRKLGGRPSRLIDPYFPVRTLANAGVALISPEIGAKGPSNNFVQSDTASAQAVAAAWDDLAENRCDVALAVGYDSLITVANYLAYEQEGLLSHSPPESAYRPFDRDRDGLVLGEGAGALVLERREDAKRRGAPVLGEICGFGSAVDISDSTALVDPGPFVQLIREQATLLGEVNMIVAHGIGTIDGDRREAIVLSTVFDRAAPVTALKCGTGYLGAATAVVEIGLGLLGLRQRKIPQLARHQCPDPEIALDLVVGNPRYISPGQPGGIFLGWSWAGQCTVLSARAMLD